MFVCVCVCVCVEEPRRNLTQHVLRNQWKKALITRQPVPMHTLAVSESSTPTCVVLQARTLSFMALYMYCEC
jgi:hypothetical protein